MCHRGSFRNDINKKCVLCKDADNGLKHVVNECAKLKNERKQLLKDLNNINNRKDNELLKAIEFHYYSKSYTNKKEENKDDNKGIKLIKEFVETLYKKMTEERNKRKHWAGERAATIAFGSSLNGAGNALCIYNGFI